MRIIPKLLVLVLMGLFTLSLSAQTTITGQVIDFSTQEPVPGATVRSGNAETLSDAEGKFMLQLSGSDATVLLEVSYNGYQSLEQTFASSGSNTIDAGQLAVKSVDGLDQISSEDIIPTVTISVEDGDQFGDDNISGLLTASRDVFVSAAAFQFGSARFRIRGYDSDHTQVFLNNTPVNDLESGRVFWGLWGGLNDVMRNRANTVGLGASGYTFGGLGGASSIDTRASSQREQRRISYASSNRSYRHRIMGVYSKKLPKGWAISLSGSRRWAEEGYVEGTSYDAWSYFAAVDKKINDKHSIGLNIIGAPVRRGQNTGSVQEMYDLAGTNYYNANWGYQNGKKRNSRMRDSHTPLGILRHDWKFNENSVLTTSLSYMTGRYGTSALDWLDAPDPRPTYYRKLPSFIEDPTTAAEVAKVLQSDVNARQINWDRIYDINRNSFGSVENADGIEGNTVSGRIARYVIEDRRYDPTRAAFNTVLESAINDELTIQGGLSFQQQQTRAFKVLEDLLGAEFYLDINRFANFDYNPDPNVAQNNLDNPNGIITEGEEFGYKYKTNAQVGRAWAQANYALSRVDFFVAGDVSRTQLWREGLVRNGFFPDNSQGESEKESFMNFGVKAGVTYKIDGRNYIVLNGAYTTRAPFMRNAMQSVRTRNEFVDNLESEKNMSVEGGYLLHSPNVKARLMGYYTRLDDRTNIRSFFFDNAQTPGASGRGGFVNYVMQDIDTEHLGIEAALEVNLFGGLRASAVAAIGQYQFRSRPDTYYYRDNSTTKIDLPTVYIENFYVPGTPQVAGTVGLSYNSPKFWFANLNLNYFDRIYMDFYPERRTEVAVATVPNPVYAEQFLEPGSDLYNRIINQDRAPSAYTLDFFGGKSFKFGDKFIYLTLGVSNLLDKQDFRTGGYEQFRFDFAGKDVDRFPPRYFYSYGRNYFAQIAFRF